MLYWNVYLLAAVLTSLCSGAVIGRMERGDLIGQEYETHIRLNVHLYTDCWHAHEEQSKESVKDLTAAGTQLLKRS